MVNKRRWIWLVAALLTAGALCGGAMGLAAAPPAWSLQDEPVLREVVIAISEPTTLYQYATTSVSEQIVLDALIDAPFTTLSYDYQATILTKVPSWADGDVVTRVVTVSESDRVLSDAGTPVTLVDGIVVRPAGCHDSSCAVTFDGTPLEMEQVVVTFTLRSAIRWSDGVLLTAQDSVFSQQIYCDPITPYSEYSCDRTALYSAPNALTAVWMGLPGYLDPTAQLNFRTPLPQHVLGAMTAAEILASDYGRSPLGWGPFKMLEWVPGSHITLERNPYYWRDGYPKLDRVTFHFMDDATLVYEAMLRGEVHVASQTVPMESYIQQLLDADVNATIMLEWTPGTAWEHMDFGILPADDRYRFFEDANVRRAIACAIDRQQIIDEAVYGLGTPLNAYIPPEHPLYPATLATYPYDPTTAEGLLAGAGWTDTNANGIRDKGGQEFVITYTTSTAAMRMQAGTLIQQDLAAVGIQVNLQFLPSYEFFHDGPEGILFGRKFDLGTFAWITGIEPPCSLYLSSQIPSDDNNWGGQNLTGYSNPAYDAACEQALAALPGTADYIEGHQTALQIFAQDLPVLPLFQRIKLMAVSSALAVGPKLNPTSNTETWNIWEWDLTATTTAEPEAEATLVAPNAILTSTFKSGTFAETALVTYTNLVPQFTPLELDGVARFFELEATSQETGEPIAPIAPYELTVTYADASIPSRLDESTLGLYFWNGTEWVLEPTSQVDVSANLVTASPSHFSTWAVLGDFTPYRVYVPLVARE